MIKILPHEILLNLLRKHYSSNNLVSFNDLLINFKVGNSEKEKIYRIREVLVMLEKKGYLEWNISYKIAGYDFITPTDRVDDKDKFKKDFLSDDKLEVYNLSKLKGLQFNGKLTMDGLEYALDIERKKAERKNNRISLRIAAFAFILSVGVFAKEIWQDKCTAEKLKNLKLQLKETDSSLQILKNQINSLYPQTQDDSLKQSLSNGAK